MDANTPLWKAHDISQQLQDKIEVLPNVGRAFVHVDHETTHIPVSTMISPHLSYLYLYDRSIESMFDRYTFTYHLGKTNEIRLTAYLRDIMLNVISLFLNVHSSMSSCFAFSCTCSGCDHPVELVFPSEKRWDNSACMGWSQLIQVYRYLFFMVS